MKMGNAMENTSLALQYEDFAALLLEESIHLDRTLGFREICSRIGADPAALDELLRKELGLSGEALLASFRERARRSANPKESGSFAEK